MELVMFIGAAMFVALAVVYATRKMQEAQVLVPVRSDEREWMRRQR